MASIRFVTSLTGAFMGNFVDFQSDFFHFSSYSQVSFLLSICFLSFFERTHRHKNFNSLLPYIVFLKLSLWASLHELAIVQAIVFRQRVSFSFLWKCMWTHLTFHTWNIFLKDYWTQLLKMHSNVSIFYSSICCQKIVLKMAPTVISVCSCTMVFQDALKIFVVFIDCHVATFDFPYFCVWNNLFLLSRCLFGLVLCFC